MNARATANKVLLHASGRSITTRDFPGILDPADSIGNVTEIRWVSANRLRFRCKKSLYPLLPVVAQSFRRFCDTVVFNYPAVLLPHDPANVIHVTPATGDMWRPAAHAGEGFQLVWEPSAGLHIPVGAIHTVADVTAKIRLHLDDPQAHALPHRWLCTTRTIWLPPRPPVSKTAAQRYVRADKIRRGRLETDCRARRLAASDTDIGQALSSITWRDIDRMRATASRQRLRLRRLKGDRISGWDRLHLRWGCPHCPASPVGGSISHIFWDCPAAQALWNVLWRGWAVVHAWAETSPGPELKRAIFSFHLPRFPGQLWSLPDLRALSPTDTDGTVTARTTWQQHVHETLAVIWKWRHDIAGDELRWTAPAARAYLVTVLRTVPLGLLARLDPSATRRDPRRQMLRMISRGFAVQDASTAPVTQATPEPLRLLFFDGGSRGNPGPGGAGSVIVEVDADAIHPRVVWSASMAYGSPTMTNNQAEYLGVIAGLRLARDRGWRLEVIGDSALVIGQLRHYRPPTSPLLRPLYSEA